MCEYQQLSRSENGYVILCRRCRHYQVAFVRTVLSLNAQEFSKLLREVRENSAEEVCRSCGPSIVIGTGKPGVHLCLGFSELKELSDMLETADSEIRALDMLSMFHSAT